MRESACEKASRDLTKRNAFVLSNSEDQDLAKRLTDVKVAVCDPCEFAWPFYHYRVDTGSYHMSHPDNTGVKQLGRLTNDSRPPLSGIPPHGCDQRDPVEVEPPRQQAQVL